MKLMQPQGKLLLNKTWLLVPNPIAATQCSAQLQARVRTHRSGSKDIIIKQQSLLFIEWSS